MPRGPAKPNKIPGLTVASDNFSMEAEGVTYYPHQGESVTFRGRQSVGDAMLAFKLQGLTEESDPQLIPGLIEDVVGGLASQIMAWTWTDDDCRPYKSPPTAETLTLLSFEELTYLVNGGKVTSSEEDLKNE
jgi:hypothetical protein